MRLSPPDTVRNDDGLVGKYNFFNFEVVKANVAVSPKHPETLHYTRRRVHGLRQDYQPKETIPAREVVK